MSNMGYCRFGNTLHDLRDCHGHLHDVIDDPEELQARRRLIQLCASIAEQGAELIEE